MSKYPKFQVAVERLFMSTITILICVLIAFFALSFQGTRDHNHLIELADRVFSNSWDGLIPENLPVQLVLTLATDGEIRSSSPFQLENNIHSYVPNYAHQDGMDVPQMSIYALGSVLEPLRDRYPLVGRTLTFSLRSYRQTDGSTISVAMWRPLTMRLYWLCYALLIYLYLFHWILTPLWVFGDAKRHNMNYRLWALLTGVANVVGLLVYLGIRNKKKRMALLTENVQ